MLILVPGVDSVKLLLSLRSITKWKVLRAPECVLDRSCARHARCIRKDNCLICAWSFVFSDCGWVHWLAYVIWCHVIGVACVKFAVIGWVQLLKLLLGIQRSSLKLREFRVHQFWVVHDNLKVCPVMSLLLRWKSFSMGMSSYPICQFWTFGLGGAIFWTWASYNMRIIQQILGSQFFLESEAGLLPFISDSCIGRLNSNSWQDCFRQSCRIVSSWPTWIPSKLIIGQCMVSMANLLAE